MQRKDSAMPQDDRKQLIIPPAPIDPWVEVQTRLRHALTVQSPQEARALARSTRASINSLEWQGAYAHALSACINAHTNVVTAMDRLYAAAITFQARRDQRDEIDEKQVIEEADAVDEAEHKRALAKKRREKELLDADQAVLKAKHALEATGEFKDTKFELGRVRAEARRRDAQVEKTTAEAAILKLAEEIKNASGKNEGQIIDWLEDRIVASEAKLRELEADGADTTDCRVALQVMRKLKATM
jgi:hypothetical protein